MLADCKEKLSYHDYLLLDDDHRYELIGGTLSMSPAPSINHQVISKRLFIRLNRFVEDNDLGMVLYAPVDVVFSNEDVVEPDILFVSRLNSHIMQDSGVFGSPDLIVEILSASSQYRDLHQKRLMYQRYRVRDYWIVDPANRCIEVLVLSDNSKFVSHCRDNQIVRSRELMG
ncbi:MAG: Uma2 family endonuclease, partial [Nitrospirae bacterium]|nr:Uma2 family endonuclease [Nitrospirota bacterium]